MQGSASSRKEFFDDADKIKMPAYTLQMLWKWSWRATGMFFVKSFYCLVSRRRHNSSYASVLQKTMVPRGSLDVRLAMHQKKENKRECTTCMWI